MGSNDVVYLGIKIQRDIKMKTKLPSNKHAVGSPQATLAPAADVSVSGKDKCL